MNIFYLSDDPVEATTFMVDAHAKGGKMICESAQLLANCYPLEVLSSTDCPRTFTGAIRKYSHYNHPVAIWTRESIENFKWLLKHAQALVAEREYRTNKGHFTSRFIDWVSANIPSLPVKSFTSPRLAMPDYCKLENPILSYRNYYNLEKRHLFRWTKRPTPIWIS